MLLEKRGPAAVLAVLLCAPLAAQTVHVVDAGGGGDFTDVQPAIDAAADGDTILVEPGLYGTAVIDDKALVVIASDPGDRPSLDPIVVRNLAAGKTVVLRHLDVDGETGVLPFVSSATAIALEDNQGGVWLENLDVTGFSSATSVTTPTAALTAHDCDRVFVLRCELRGGAGRSATELLPSQAGADAVVCAGSRVLFEGGLINGGNGGAGIGFPVPAPGSRGGDGIDATGAALFLSGANVNGGLDFNSGAGSDGLHAEGGALVQHLDTLFDDGFGGRGEAIDADASVVVQDLADDARSVDGNGPVREGAIGRVTYSGVMGDEAYLLVDVATGWFPLIGKKGIFSLATAPIGPLPIGPVTAASGKLTVVFTAIDLMGLDAVTAFVQAYAITGGGVRLATPGSVTLVAASF